MSNIKYCTCISPKKVTVECYGNKFLVCTLSKNGCGREILEFTELSSEKDSVGLEFGDVTTTEWNSFKIDFNTP